MSLEEIIDEGLDILQKRQDYLQESLAYAEFVRDAIAEYVEMAEEEPLGTMKRGQLLAEAQMLRNRSRERVRQGRGFMEELRRSLSELIPAIYIRLEDVDEEEVEATMKEVNKMEDALVEWLPRSVSDEWNVF